MRKRDFDKFYGRYKATITAIARKLVGSDDDMVQDLEQVGALALLRLNPKRAKTNADAWIRQAIKNRMIDYLRKDKPPSVRIESLDGRLESGDQLEQHASGEFHLITSRPTPPKLHEETVWEGLEENEE